MPVVPVPPLYERGPVIALDYGYNREQVSASGETTVCPSEWLNNRVAICTKRETLLSHSSR